MSEICYKKNYLQEVVAVIQFASPIKALNEAVLPEQVQEILNGRYPIFESQKAITQNVIFNE